MLRVVTATDANQIACTDPLIYNSFDNDEYWEWQGQHYSLSN